MSHKGLICNFIPLTVVIVSFFAFNGIYANAQVIQSGGCGYDPLNCYVLQLDCVQDPTTFENSCDPSSADCDQTCPGGPCENGGNCSFGSKRGYEGDNRICTRQWTCGYTGPYTYECAGWNITCNPLQINSWSCGICSSGPNVNLTADPPSVDSGASSTLSWTSSDATSCSATGGPWSGAKPLSGSEPTGPLFSNTTYEITCTDGASSDSSTATVAMNAPPTPPPPVCPPPGVSGFSASAMCSGTSPEVNLSWSATTVPQISIRRCVGACGTPGDPPYTTTTGTSYTDTGVNLGTEYRYTAAGYDPSCPAGSQTSAYSVVRIVTTPSSCGPPSPPTGLNATCNAAGDQVTLTWNPASGATWYQLRVNNGTNDAAACLDGWFCADPPDKIVNDYTSTSYLASVTPGDPYQWWVHSSNTSGNSSATVANFTCSAPPPDILASADCNPESQSAETGQTVSWTGTTEGDAPLTCTWSGDLGDSPSSVSDCTGFNTTYSTAGSKTVTLSVDDTDGDTDLDSCTADITEPETLFVDITAATDSATWQNSLSGKEPLNGVDLRAIVSGTASGTVNYTFYCNRPDDGVNITFPVDAKDDGVGNTTYIVNDVCNYSAPGTYVAKVIAERGSAPADEERITITVDPADATIQGLKVVDPGQDPGPNPPAGETITVNGASPTTVNPFSFTVLSNSSYTVATTVPAGFAIGYTACIDDTTCHSNPPTPGSSFNISLPSGPGHFADIRWHFNRVPGVSSVTATQPDYCLLGPSGVEITWSFDDPGDTQSAYQVQYIRTSDGTVVHDTGKVLSSSGPDSPPAVTLNFNTSYFARVWVWDSGDNKSSSADSSAWTTPPHSYPTADFNWTPTIPAVNQTVQFTNQSSAYGGASITGWQWDFDILNNPATQTSSQQNPTHKFGQERTYQVRLIATDSDGFECPTTQAVDVSGVIPIWKEVPPKN